MPTIVEDKPKSAINEHATRQRLFAFLAQPDTSIHEIVDQTQLSAATLGLWMVGYSADGPTQKIGEALDRIEAIDRLMSAGVPA
jgi:hypothetical protein